MTEIVDCKAGLVDKRKLVIVAVAADYMSEISNEKNKKYRPIKPRNFSYNKT